MNNSITILDTIQISVKLSFIVAQLAEVRKRSERNKEVGRKIDL